MLTRVNRAALLLGPMIAGAILLAMQAARRRRHRPAARPGAGDRPARPGGGDRHRAAARRRLLRLTMRIALRTGNAAATSGASFLFFPLSFLTATFVPYDLLTGWIKTAAFINPITYILDAMRQSSTPAKWRNHPARHRRLRGHGPRFVHLGLHRPALPHQAEVDLSKPHPWPPVHSGEGNRLAERVCGRAHWPAPTTRRVGATNVSPRAGLTDLFDCSTATSVGGHIAPPLRHTPPSKGVGDDQCVAPCGPNRPVRRGRT